MTSSSTLCNFAALTNGEMQLRSISNRIEHTKLNIVSPQDFTLGTEAIDNGELCPLMYCADFSAQIALYSLIRKDDLQDVFAAPFLYMGQRRLATGVLTVPFARLPMLSGSEQARPTFIFSGGRAGSTLLTRLLQAVDLQAISEPDLFTQIAVRSNKQPPAGSRYEAPLMRACIASLTPYCGADPFIKLRSHCSDIADKIALSFTGSRAVFLFRDARSWALSRHRAFPRETPKRVAAILGESVRAIERLSKIGAPVNVIWYDDLRNHPRESLIKLLSRSARSAASILAGITLAAEADSQEGSAVSRAALSRRGVAPEFLNEFDRELRALALDPLLEKHDLRRLVDSA